MFPTCNTCVSSLLNVVIKICPPDALYVCVSFLCIVLIAKFYVLCQNISSVLLFFVVMTILGIFVCLMLPLSCSSDSVGYFDS